MPSIFNVLFAIILTSSFSGAALAADVQEVFSGDMLGTNQRYFESVAGVPRESYGDDHLFRVKGCDITATIGGGKVDALRMELSDKCQVDLSSFIGSYAPAPGGTLTAGTFSAAAGAGLSYSANCLSMCGNAYDPSVYAIWQGPRAADFTEVILEVVLADDKAIDAANLWEKHMVAAEGEEYVMDTRFNCDNRFDEVALLAFKDIQITALTIGHHLKTPGC